MRDPLSADRQGFEGIGLKPGDRRKALGTRLEAVGKMGKGGFKDLAVLIH